MLWSKEKDGWCLDPSLCMKIIKTELVKEQYTQIAGNNFCMVRIRRLFIH